MHPADKLDILASGAQYDLSCACGGATLSRRRGPLGRWIYPSPLPSGGEVKLLKVLLTNECTRSCSFCSLRRQRNVPRASFRADELARAYMEMHRSGSATGLFLSSAISGSVTDTMSGMLKTAELIRYRHRFKGWLHLKILPGASREEIKRAGKLANRVSLNLEVPTAARMKKIAPQKRHDEILERIAWVQEVVEDPGMRCHGQTTQFIVGAAEEPDREIIDAAFRLYSHYGLSRVYFSSFQPVPGTPLEGGRPAEFIREHRLYQADFLLRKYGFKADDLVTNPSGNLPMEIDPKLAWARKNPESFPVDINKAGRAELLKVPGIGPLTASKIIKARVKEKLKSIEQLKCLSPTAGQAEPFILINGKRPSMMAGAQLRMEL